MYKNNAKLNDKQRLRRRKVTSMILATENILNSCSWLGPVLTIIVSAVIPTVVGYLIKRTLDKHFNERDAIEKKNKKEHDELQKIKEEKEREERKDDMKETVKEAIKPLEKKVEVLHEKLFVNSEGTVTLLRDRMKITKDIYIARGYASDSDKANWNQLYKAYKQLGGNHFKEYVDQWKVSIEELPATKNNRNRLNNNEKPKKNLEFFNIV